MTKKWSSTRSGDGQTKREASKADRREGNYDINEMVAAITPENLHEETPSSPAAVSDKNLARCLELSSLLIREAYSEQGASKDTAIGTAECVAYLLDRISRLQPPASNAQEEA